MEETKPSAAEAVKPTETTSTPAPVAAPVSSATTPAKKKPNIVLIIVGIILGIGVLCTACVGTGIWGVFKTMQNTEQSTTVKTLFEALNTGDEATVKSVSGETLYNDLYKKTNGTTLADKFKNSFVSITFSSVSVENSTAKVEFKITGKGTNKSLIETVTYAELQKDDSGWFVTYIGQKTK